MDISLSSSHFLEVDFSVEGCVELYSRKGIGVSVVLALDVAQVISELRNISQLEDFAKVNGLCSAYL